LKGDTFDILQGEYQKGFNLLQGEYQKGFNLIIFLRKYYKNGLGSIKLGE